MQVLLVEDTHFAALVATTLLKNAGHSIDVAETGQKAIDLVNQNSYEIVFMDIGLPDMDGFQAAMQIKKQHPDLKIIGLTAHGIDDHYRSEAQKNQFIDIISKPLTQEYVDNLSTLLSC